MIARLVAIGAFGAAFVAVLSCGPVASECEQDDQCDEGYRCDAASRLCVVDEIPIEALVLDGKTLPEAIQGQSWSYGLLASGGVPPYSWSFESRPASLAWLSLDSATGRLSGTPSELLPATSFDVGVSDSAAARRTAAFVVSVRACINGEKVPCAGPVDGLCQLGEQICENGTLGACVLTGPSDRIEACGEACSACDPKIADSCVGGACQCGGQAACAAGQTCCGGTCVNTNTHPDACGGCGKVCDTDRANVQRTCVAGSCEYPCAQGWGRCSPNEGDASCVTNVMNDMAHCGGCGRSCPQTADNATGITCENGACKVTGCKTGFADCDGVATNGCERNLKTDPDHCGTCNNKCPTYANSTRSCGDGQCGTTCNSNYANCNNDLPADGCEANLLINKSHCGTCGKVCDECSNGVCGERCSSTLVCWAPDVCFTCEEEFKPGFFRTFPCCI